MSRSQAFEESENVGRNASANPTMGDIIATRYNRRDLLRNSLAVAAITATVSPLALAAGRRAEAATPEASFGFTEIEAGVDETHHVAPGYRADVLIRWGDPVLPGAPAFDANAQTAAAQKQQFGYNNDFVGFFPIEGSSEHGLLVVNHEYTNEEIMFPGLSGPQDTKEAGFGQMTQDMADVEMAAHGGSVLEIRKVDGRWQVVPDSKYNRRITTSDTEMELTGPAAGHALAADHGRPHRQDRGRHGQQLRRRRHALGHLAQRRGELPRLFLGQGRRGLAAGREPQALRRARATGTIGAPTTTAGTSPRSRTSRIASAGWSRSTRSTRPRRPRSARPLGRFKHEGAGMIVNKDGKVVAYMGDDERFDYLYRFVSAGTFDPDQPRRQHGPARRGHALGRASSTTTARSTGCRWCTARAR